MIILFDLWERKLLLAFELFSHRTKVTASQILDETKQMQQFTIILLFTITRRNIPDTERISDTFFNFEAGKNYLKNKRISGLKIDIIF